MEDCCSSSPIFFINLFLTLGRNSLSPHSPLLLDFQAYSRSLKFDAKPDIPYLRKIFRDLYNTQGCASVVSTDRTGWFTLMAVEYTEMC